MSDRRFDQGGRVAAACQAFLTHFFRYPLSVEIPETGAGQFRGNSKRNCPCRTEPIQIGKLAGHLELSKHCSALSFCHL